jgi:uncharacterized protein (DUF1330 family)
MIGHHAHGGEYFAVSENIKRYEGDGPDPDAIVLFTFPSVEAIDAFVSDAEYRRYGTARRASFFGQLVCVHPLRLKSL